MHFFINFIQYKSYSVLDLNKVEVIDHGIDHNILTNIFTIKFVPNYLKLYETFYFSSKVSKCLSFVFSLNYWLIVTWRNVPSVKP